MNPKINQKIGVDLLDLDRHLDSISAMAKDPTMTRAEFYPFITRHIVTCSGAYASIIMSSNELDQVRIVSQYGWSELSPSIAGKVRKHIGKIFSGEDRVGLTKPMFSAYHGTCRTSRDEVFLFLLVRTSKEPVFAGQVFSDIAWKVAEQIAVFENRLATAQEQESNASIREFAKLMDRLDETECFDELSFQIVKAAVDFSNADRVTYLENSGKVRAMSPTNSAKSKKTLARGVTYLSRMAMVLGKNIEWSEGLAAVQGGVVPRGIAKLVQALPTIAGFAMPLIVGNRTYGALLFEYFSNELELNLERHRRVEACAEIVVPLIAGRRRKLDS